MKGDQFTEEYKKICPNKKVPAIAFVGMPVSVQGFSVQQSACLASLCPHIACVDVHVMCSRLTCP